MRMRMNLVCCGCFGVRDSLTDHFCIATDVLSLVSAAILQFQVLDEGDEMLDYQIGRHIVNIHRHRNEPSSGIQVRATPCGAEDG